MEKHSFLELIHLAFVGFFVLAFPALRCPFFEPAITPNDAERPTGRQRYYDIIRGIAIAAVLLGHVTKIYPEYYANASDIWLWSIANFCRFAIPVFLISSSILLNPAGAVPAKLRQFFGAKLSRIIIPYLVCVFAIGLYHAEPWYQIVAASYSGDAAVPYYYIPVLAQLYLLYPLLLPIRKSRWFLPASMLVSIVFLILPWRLGGTFFCGSYFFFFAYGLYHRERFLLADQAAMSSRKHLLSCLSLIGLSWLEFALFPYRHYNQLYFYGIACFECLFILRAYLSTVRIAPVLAHAGNISLWIFLTHYWIQQEIAQALQPYASNFFVDILCFSVISTIVCCAAAHLCHILYRGAAKIIFPAYLSPYK